MPTTSDKAQNTPAPVPACHPRQIAAIAAQIEANVPRVKSRAFKTRSSQTEPPYRLPPGASFVPGTCQPAALSIKLCHEGMVPLPPVSKSWVKIWAPFSLARQLSYASPAACRRRKIWSSESPANNWIAALQSRGSLL